uniref:Transcriptional regulator n=1 Tax=Heterorhabditis bacteriophora TaxID=37862 RepID=A0A1I7XNS2_HETBA
MLFNCLSGDIFTYKHVLVTAGRNNVSLFRKWN